MATINQQGAKVGYLFRLDSTHANILKLDGTALGTFADFTALVDGTNAFIVGGGDTSNARLLIQTDHSYDDAGLPTIKLTQSKFGGSLDTLIEAIIPRKTGVSAAGMNELADQEGNTVGGTTSSSGTPLLYVEYSTKSATTARVCATICTMKASSGGYSMKNKEWIQPAIELVGAACVNNSGFTLATKFINPALVSTAATITIPVNYYEKAVEM